TLFIDIRCMLKPIKYIDLFSKEIKVKNEKHSVDYSRCPQCNIVMPSQFILISNNNNVDRYLFKSFKEKAVSEALLYIGDMIRDNNFPKEKTITSNTDLMNIIYEVMNKYKDEK